LTHKIYLHPEAVRYLDRCDKALRQRIKNRLRDLEEEPFKGQRLKHSRYRRLRIGEYRAIYTIYAEKEEVIILYIGHRRNVYDDFSRLF